MSAFKTIDTRASNWTNMANDDHFDQSEARGSFGFDSDITI